MRWLLVLLLVATAHADDKVTGFRTFGTGPMSGRVTGADGKPIAGARVHVATRNGVKVVTTDKDGVYKVELDGQSLIYVDDIPGAKLGGESAASVKVDGEEAIEVHATVPPKKMPTPKQSPLKVYEYTDAAIDKDVWIRAWVMLDIDETGVVRHVKFLNRAGYGLDTVMLKAAFTLKFDPARDAADKPMRTLMVWPFEWPSYSWSHGYDLTETTTPPPCRKPNDKHAETRDCSGPDMSRAFVERWIAPRATK